MADADFDEMIAASRREREGWALTRIHLAVPFLAVGTAVVLLWADERLARTGAAAAAALFYLGKLVILTGAAPRSTFQMASLELAALVFFMDLVVAYLFAFNLHYIYRVPRVGPWLERLQSYCRFWLATHRWMRKWAFTAVMLFVMFPLTGTGAPAGTLLGRIVGLKPWTTLSAIALGSALGCTMMAAFAKPLEPVFHDIQEEVWFKALGLVVLGALLLALIALGRRLSRAAENHARETKAA